MYPEHRGKPTMHQVYISYDPADENFALQLAEDLSAYGARTWIDVRDARPGRHWERSIEQALNESGMMVVVLSPEALVSKQVAMEWQAFLEAYRPVMPVVVVPCDLPAPLRARRPIAFTRASRYRRSFHELITRLIEYNTRVRHIEPLIWPSANSSSRRPTARAETASARRYVEQAIRGLRGRHEASGAGQR